MVHARYGSKDAILDEVVHHRVREASSAPTPDPDPTGLQQALAHFDRISVARTPRTPTCCGRCSSLTFEAAKTTSPGCARYIRVRLKRGGGQGRSRDCAAGIADGSVRPDIDIERAVNDISAAVFGTAYQWIMRLPLRHGRELDYLRAQLIHDYGSLPADARRNRSEAVCTPRRRGARHGFPCARTALLPTARAAARLVRASPSGRAMHRR